MYTLIVEDQHTNSSYTRYAPPILNERKDDS